MDITISGPIGSGKSTVARELARITGRQYLSFGEIFRRNAARLGMSVEEFNLYAETHENVDREQDRELIETMKKNHGTVIDSRLAGWLSFREGIPALRIYISAPFDIRSERVAKREKISPEHASERIVRREESEGRRYWRLYSIDVRDISIYEMVIDSGNLTPETIVSQIMTRARSVVDGIN